MNRSRTAGESESALTASRSVGIGCQHEWPRTESQALIALLSFQPDLTASVSHPKLALRNDEFRRHCFQNGTSARHCADSVNHAQRHTPGNCLLHPSPRVSAAARRDWVRG